MNLPTPDRAVIATELAERLRWDRDGLVPAIVQDEGDGRVLMLAYMDREALAATMASGDVHFHSRSRNALWRKGETSGNVLRLRAIQADCDADALLVTVDPIGPTCHRGTRSCFDPDLSSAELGAAPRQGFEWLETLWATIDERRTADPATSYTAKLLSGGVDRAARKVTEEATEVLMAAKDLAVPPQADRDARRAALAGETADLLYHLLVLLAERGLEPREVIDVLRARRGAPHSRSVETTIR